MAKKFKTIEKLPNGNERKVAVIEKFDDKSEYICSIGDIKSINSDLMNYNDKQSIRIKPEEFIKKLILKPDSEEDKKNKRRVS